MDVACPSCGNPHLDVDEKNNVVYCSKCGFAVRVDPATGQTQTISAGNAGGLSGAPAGPSPGSSMTYGSRTVFGLDSLTFLLGGTALVLLLTFMGLIQNQTILLGALAAVIGIYFFFRS